MEKDMADMRQKINEMNRHYFAMRASSLPEGKRAVLLYEETMAPMELRKFCEYLTENKPDTIFFLVSKKDENALNYAIGSGTVNLKPLLKEWNTRLHGRGGGKDIMQGSFACPLEEVKKLVEEMGK